MPGSRYQEMNRAEIDRQLNLRERCPEHGEYFERWASESAAARARLEGRLDLAYGETEGETLDLFPDPGRCSPLSTVAIGRASRALDLRGRLRGDRGVPASAG